MNSYDVKDLTIFYDLTGYTEWTTCVGAITEEGKPKAVVIVGLDNGKVISCHAYSIAWLEEILKNAKGELSAE
jgi:hypothetical protein